MFLFHEAEEILNIRILVSEGDDILAWHYENSSTAELARLLIEIFLSQHGKPWCHKKVKTFIWKLACNGLGIQSNMLSHHLIFDATCPIYGMEPEDGCHTMVRCTFAFALRHALRHSWNLPDKWAFTYTGPNWILALLNSANKDIKVKRMLLFWKIWHVWEWPMAHLCFGIFFGKLSSLWNLREI